MDLVEVEEEVESGLETRETGLLERREREFEAVDLDLGRGVPASPPLERSIRAVNKIEREASEASWGEEVRGRKERSEREVSLDSVQPRCHSHSQRTLPNRARQLMRVRQVNCRYSEDVEVIPFLWDPKNPSSELL